MKTTNLDSEIKKEHIQLGRGNIISSRDIFRNPGDYPIYSSSAKGMGEFGRYGDYMFDEELITWSVDGGGRFFYRPKHKFSVTNVSGFMRVDAEVWNRKFVYYSLDLQHQKIAFDYQMKAHPSVIRHIYELIEFRKPEQTKIAEVLSTVDRAIEQTEALIAKQQRIKTGVMQDMLTRGIDEHGNLRSEQTHEFKDSPLGQIPAEWSTVKLDKLVSRVGSGVTPRGGESVYTPEGVLFIRSQNVHFDGLRLNDVTYIPERIHLSMLRSEIFENDVLLNITGASIGRCCRMPKIDGCANVNQHVCTIRLLGSTEATAGVLAAVITHIGQHQIAQLNAGGNREGLNYQQVRSLMLPWPSDDSEFARIYSGIRQVTDCLIASQTSLGKLRLLKAGLMQDLLTGNRCVTPLFASGAFGC